MNVLKAKIKRITVSLTVATIVNCNTNCLVFSTLTEYYQISHYPY
jgi:hypothetical protein